MDRKRVFRKEVIRLLSDRNIIESSRKYFDYFKLRRIKKSMTYAAKTGRIYHLWWHPHNFGINLKDNMSFLIKVLEHYLFLKNKYGMQSLNMNEIYCRYSSVSNKE